MNVSMFVRSCIMKQGLCMIYCLFYLKMFPPVRPFTKSESWPVVGFSPHVGSTGVFGIAPKHTGPSVLVREGGVSAANQAIGLYGFITVGLRVPANP